MHTNVLSAAAVADGETWGPAVDEPAPSHAPAHTARPVAGAGGDVDGWPRWVARLALADFCSLEVVRIAARSAGVEVSRGVARALVANMEGAGLFRESAVGGVFLLRAEVVARWKAELEQHGPGVDEVRRQLVAAGLAQQSGGIGPRLAALALESGDWAGSEAVWRLYPSGELIADPKVCAGYAAAPTEVRASHPGLTIACAIASAYEPASGRLDLDRMVTLLIRDGRTLHGSWQQHASVESRVVAGTLSLLAHAALPGSDPGAPVELDAQTYEALVSLIRDSALSHAALTARALTLFHSAVGLISLLRGDWSRARKEAEYALILNDGCGVPGFLAALVLGLSCALAGDSQGSGVAEAFLAEHAAHCCRPRAWLEPAFHLVHADAALRALDEEAATLHLQRHAQEASQSQWLSAPALHAALLSTSALLWGDPEQALARFDALVPQLAGVDADGNPWATLLLRCRAELLLAIGAAGQAERTIVQLTQAADNAIACVPSAWFDLCAGRVSEALAKTDDGIFEARVSLADRAYLYALKSAALRQAGAADELVASAATAACVTCEQAGNLLPFAVLPGSMRSRLLGEHRGHHDSECYLSRALQRGAFDHLGDAELELPPGLRLTPREEVLLPLLATAASVPEIANQQYVSVNTLRKQVVTLRQKFGAATRDDLVRKAHEAGLLNRTAKAGPPSFPG